MSSPADPTLPGWREEVGLQGAARERGSQLLGRWVQSPMEAGCGAASGSAAAHGGSGCKSSASSGLSGQALGNSVENLQKEKLFSQTPTLPHTDGPRGWGPWARGSAQ